MISYLLADRAVDDLNFRTPNLTAGSVLLNLFYVAEREAQKL